MGFIADIFTAIVTIVVAIIVYIVDVVVQVVEVIIHLVMILLGWEPDSQTIEYFEVRHIPLFTEVDTTNPLLEVIYNSILIGSDLSKELIYAQVFRTLKGDFRKFMDFIDDGNYFESFPTIESYILVIDYTELNAALVTLTGGACTPTQSALDALNYQEWIQYWLQENKTYDVGANRIDTDFAEVSTSPGSVDPDTVAVLHTLTITDGVGVEDSVTVNALSPVTAGPTTPVASSVVMTHALTVTSEVETSDSMTVEGRWQVDFNDITYNSGPDNYTIGIYNDDGDTDTLPYTVPSIPTGLHYIVYYYENSDPSRGYLFVYEVGLGTYVDLDTVENPIDIDGSTIETVPAIPLRIDNANYSTFGAGKAADIEEICDLINLDPQAMIDEILSDPDLAPGDIDHVYINFGVRMRDTSQTAMNYLFNFAENIYAAQGVTQGIYNNASADDDKPQNRIITTTDDHKYVMQFSYITFNYTSLATIDANPGSTEHTVYYSNLSKFNDSNILVYPYYSSSAKGTYNVGYIASDASEVADFLSGSGVAAPGTPSAEGANWLQVTQRISYNNPTPVLQDPDSTTSAQIYLTPDRVYENNGGTLRLIEAAAEETTIGQTITYYYADQDGLDAYTIVQPIGAVKVIDGDTGVFKTIKFNLGDELELMVPLVHTFIKDLSNKDVTQMFLSGAHVAIYIAHYEVIQPASMSFLTALVLLVVIVVIIYFAYQAGVELAAKLTALAVEVAATTTTAAAFAVLKAALVPVLKKVVIGFAVRAIVVEVAKTNEELALILAIVSVALLSSYEFGGPDTPSGFKTLTSFDYAVIAAEGLNSYNEFILEPEGHRRKQELALDEEAFRTEKTKGLALIEDIWQEIHGISSEYTFDSELGNYTDAILTATVRKKNVNPILASDYFTIADQQITGQYEIMFNQGAIIDFQVSAGNFA